MQMRKLSVVLIYFALIGVGVGAYLFSIKGTIEVFEGNITVSPQSFSVDVAKGVEYVKQIKVNNSGNSVCIYFEDVVEGPTPDKVDVSYKDEQGNSIYSSNKLCLSEGSKDNPSVTKINVHIIVKEEASDGKYSVYIFPRT
ncbi:MAG: hypothetical protein QXO16_04015 [Archaeoglobaceae archaeon]